MSSSSNQAAGTPPSAPVEGQAPVTPLPGLTPQASQQVPAATIPLPLSTTTPPPPQANSINQSIGFQVADDKDVIEPEWVHKAKAIVLTNSDDPYKQSEELTVFKADYMQKRYNKTVKLK